MGLAEDMRIIKDAELDIELLHRDNDKLCANNNKDISELEEKITSTEFIMQEELNKSGEDKIECKFDGYKGSMGWQKMPDKWIYKEKELWSWIKSLPDLIKTLFIKITVTMKKADLKKRIMDDNEVLFENSKIIEKYLNTDVTGGELYIYEKKKKYKVEGIEIERQDPKFKYSIKKIK